MQTSAPWVVASWVLLHVVLYRTATAAGTAFVDDVTDFRIRSQNLHVDYIEKQLEKLESELNEWTEPKHRRMSLQVKARVQRLESWLIMPIIFLMFFLP
jgi:t-SNARE complex subunit (syntaxin)